MALRRWLLAQWGDRPLVSEPPDWYLLLRASLRYELAIWDMAALVGAYGDLGYAYAHAAQYLNVPIDELIERTERGETVWLNWALVGSLAEREAREELEASASS